MINLQAAYEMIDGMEWKLSGVHGTLRVVKINGMTEIEHHPSKDRGMRTKAYKATRRELGDDYVTRIDFDSMGEIFAHVESISK